MNIAYKDVFSVLAHALPGCPVAEKDWQEPLPYVAMQEILSFVCQRADLGFKSDIDEFSILLEKLASEGDSDVHDLVVDALDGLSTCPKREIIATRFGPKVQQLWASVSKQKS